MKTVYSAKHLGHAGNVELGGNTIVPAFEKPSRAEMIRARVEQQKLGPLVEPKEHDLAAAKRVHRADFIDLLPTVWDRWTAAGKSGSAMPITWPTRAVRGDVAPTAIEALLGFYSFDGAATFVQGTWDAIKSSYDVALTAAALVQDGESSAFALCRPPGHHAGSASMGGYCFINNAAVVSAWYRDRGARKVSILDVDYHHGNGTQQIFYDRGDVQLVSLHADPLTEYPYFLGHADERGVAAGEGFNRNYPMPFGTAWATWGQALDAACEDVAGHAPDVLVVSLGVDTFENDPISRFKLKSADYPRIGARIAKLGLPTLFVMEGGYAVDEIGINAVGVLSGFEGA